MRGGSGCHSILLCCHGNTSSFHGHPPEHHVEVRRSGCQTAPGHMDQMVENILVLFRTVRTCRTSSLSSACMPSRSGNLFPQNISLAAGQLCTITAQMRRCQLTAETRASDGGTGDTDRTPSTGGEREKRRRRREREEEEEGEREKRRIHRGD